MPQRTHAKTVKSGLDRTAMSSDCHDNIWEAHSGSNTFLKVNEYATAIDITRGEYEHFLDNMSRIDISGSYNWDVMDDTDQHKTKLPFS